LVVVVDNVKRTMEEEPELSPAAAAKKAMTQVTAPIIAISLVLLAVFVPVGFMSGISGVLFQHFAVTIIAAMLISAFNALTLSPALCAVLLRHSDSRRGFMAFISRGINGVRDGYAVAVRKIVRLSVLSIVLIVAFGLGLAGMARMTPVGFLPEEDQGAFFIAFQLPDGASVARTGEAVGASSNPCRQVRNTISVIGYSFLDRFSACGASLRMGRLNYSMRIWFDTDRLISLGLAPSDIIQAVQAQNIQAPPGRIGARPVPDDQQFQLNVQTQEPGVRDSSSMRLMVA
jgi:HAE1 family hydrophobic/amphiphilic exporter-1